jgi:hypothetical protein
VKGFKVGSYCIEVIITNVELAGTIPPGGSITEPQPAIDALIVAVRAAVLAF